VLALLFVDCSIANICNGIKCSITFLWVQFTGLFQVFQGVLGETIHHEPISTQDVHGGFIGTRLDQGPHGSSNLFSHCSFPSIRRNRSSRLTILLYQQQEDHLKAVRNDAVKLSFGPRQRRLRSNADFRHSLLDGIRDGLLQDKGTAVETHGGCASETSAAVSSKTRSPASPGSGRRRSPTIPRLPGSLERAGISG